MARKKAYYDDRGTRTRAGYKSSYVRMHEDDDREIRCRQVFAEIIALSLDAVAHGVALGDLDRNTFAVQDNKDGRVSDTRMHRRIDAAEAAVFIRSRAAASLCDSLKIDQPALYRRVRQLADQKAQRVAEQRVRDAKRKERRLQFDSLRRIKRNAEAEIRRLKSIK